VQSWIQQLADRLNAYVSTAVLLREATRSSRRWQTYATRTAFAGVLLAVLLLSIHATLRAANTGLLDIANLGMVGRLLFVGYAVVQMGLVATIAPLTTANAVREETEQRTLDLLLLTKLTPIQIVFGKVLSRIGILLTMVLGSMPVLLLAVSMGGVSLLEVVALTVHSLTVALIGASLGGFFGLFTRSPLLSTLAALGYGIPFYIVLPAGYALVLGGPEAASLFSPLSVAAWSTPAALLMPLSYLPSLVVMLTLLASVFGLRASGASFQEAYSHTLWRTKIWGIGLGAWAVMALPGVMAIPFALLDQNSVNWVGWGMGKAAEVFLWGMMTWFYALATWVYLRLAFDVVDALDGLFGRRGTVVLADDVRVGTHSVWWRETRHGTITIGPVVATWGLVMLGLFQTGWWAVPGGVLAIGVANATATLMLTAWLGTRAFTEERRNHTLEALITTTMGSGRIVFDKLSAVLWPTLPLWLATGPFLALGVPHFHLLSLYGDPDAWRWAWIYNGLLAWAWTLPVWVAVAGVSLAMGLLARTPRSAFGLTVAATTVVLVPAGLVGQLFPDVPLLGTLARFWAPGLTGQAGIGHYLLSAVLWGGFALLVPALMTRRLRAWALRVLGLLLMLATATAPGLALAQEPASDLPTDVEALQQLAMKAKPWLDGHVRSDGWTAAVVELRNTGAAATGQLVLDDRLTDEASARWTRQIELPPGGTKRVLLPFVAADTGRTRELRFVTESGRFATATIVLNPMQASDVLVAVIGDDPLGLQAALRSATGAHVPRHGTDVRPKAPPVPPDTPRDDVNQTAGPRVVRATNVVPSQLPTSSQVLSGVDWIVWPDADPSRLSADQAEALAGWVVDGGHLLLTVTETARQLEASPLADILPGHLEGPKVDGVDPFLTKVVLPPDATPILSPSPQTPVAHFLPRVGTEVFARTTGGQPLWVGAKRGTGSVHLFLADLTLSPFPELDREALWRTLLWMPDQSAVPKGFPTEVRGAYGSSDRHEAFEKHIRALLADVPGLAPIPIEWLVLASLVYLLLIGPFDYFVLRWSGRQPLTWITFPSFVVLFTVGAFFALRSTRGSQAMLTRVELVDVFPDARHWQGTSHIGVFSTRKTDLKVSSGERDAVLSTLDVPGFLVSPGLTAGYGPGAIAYRAETWTMAYLKTEWVRPDEGRLMLQRLPDGTLQVENRLGIDLEALGLYERHQPVASFGAVADGAIVTAAREPRAEAVAVYQQPEQWRHRGHRGSLWPAETMLVGHASAPADGLDLQGLAPVHRTDLVIRQPVSAGELSDTSPQEDLP